MDLFEHLLGFYPPSECRVLFRQQANWRSARPLAGLRILDGTPLFRNTLMKLAVLQAAGADVTAAYGHMPFSQEAVDLGRTFGLRIEEKPSGEDFDVVLDCGGCYAQRRPRCGAVELTLSGMRHYREASMPVFAADSGRIKKIETELGTGDGFVRAMRQLGYPLAGKRVAVFGCGKVGKGVVRGLLSAGAIPVTIDVQDAGGPNFISAGDVESVVSELKRAFCIVTATGIRHALDGRYPPEAFLDHGALLANMGVEDEFGPGIPDARILNDNRPLNFILAEPTRMRFIDPVMGLHNAGALWLLGEGRPAGCSVPPAEVEDAILKDWEEEI